ncbi:FMN-binding glutamate synthase family protein [Pseudooceanicola sediminis]|uniref:FMN-binding glutamate synthase family protein n=1 Tax=Pseudooceanicola sediminis TaxID=2211117 RepID=A0A399IX39_9RHOB|nr:FMN-binding glutamate synthase family protein [Pseudooceanicola sediminis]KAA2312573.1 FMN-binding glutamate synthase family protein [Puniceibacterium sp. HSS470]RII37581.1 FMN-binding glutamate synthase family protein [Pseudooceanicola sediminis]|tara:strand:- start:2056 stop:3600 length:1545 start_codon:yes stop_codon:yes gene_type:complete
MELVAPVIEWLIVAFVFAIGIAVLAVVVMFLLDISQREDAVRRNYPVIGRFRAIFTKLGEFFRQYFFAMDREEMPFNRAQRDWVYTAAKGQGNTVAFGSTKNLSIPGTPIFVNAVFPPLDDQFAMTKPLQIGPYARHPYMAPSIFNISGMSFGALSQPAVEALSMGAKEAGIWLNTGEGGLSPHHLVAECDIVFQIGTAKFGVRDHAGNLSDEKLRAVASKPQVKMFELKLAQGAKPGKGGILPAAKIDEEVAEIRGVPMGVDAVSPNRHAEIDDFGDLLDVIGHIREVTGKPVGFKTVIGSSDAYEELFEMIRTRGPESAPDFITIDGGEGGTGAAPMPLMDMVGMPLREALLRMVDMRDKYGLKNRIRIIASGKMVNPGDVAWAICAGADFVTSARGFMFSLGCIQALKCNKNTCPTGITTHDPHLQRGLVPERKFMKVANFARAVVKEVEMIAHSVGVAEPRLMRRRHVRIVQANGDSIVLRHIRPSFGGDDLPAEASPNKMPVQAPDSRK